VPFGIKLADRTKHVYVIGKTGMGKSTLLENMAVQDIQNGAGFAFIDPHGKTAELLLDYIPEHRIDDVLYFAPFDLEYPVAFNVMEDVGADKRHLVASGLMSTFKKIWVDAWSARMEYILNNTVLALLEYPGATLLDINRMLSNKDYRKRVVDNITDVSVRSFWVDEFAKYTDRFAAEATPAIQNKVGQFTSNPLIRNIIGQPKSTFDLRKIMDDRKIIIINLSKGKVGESNANLLGSMMITKIYLAAMSRADANERELSRLPNFYLYVDEFQSFANESFANILSEARKYKLNLTIAHQYIEQMSEEVRAAVFGNVGTMVSFRVGAFDAEVLEKEFAPQFTAEDLVNLGIYQIYLKLMIDGVTSIPFSATTLPPITRPAVSFKPEIIDTSRTHFARKRMIVEGEIRLSQAPDPKPEPRLETKVSRRFDRPTKPASTSSSPPPIGGGSSLRQALSGVAEQVRAAGEKRVANSSLVIKEKSLAVSPSLPSKQPTQEFVSATSRPPSPGRSQTDAHTKPRSVDYNQVSQRPAHPNQRPGHFQPSSRRPDHGQPPREQLRSARPESVSVSILNKPPLSSDTRSASPNSPRSGGPSELKKALADLINQSGGETKTTGPTNLADKSLETVSQGNRHSMTRPADHPRGANQKQFREAGAGVEKLVQDANPDGPKEVPEVVLRRIFDANRDQG